MIDFKAIFGDRVHEAYKLVSEYELYVAGNASDHEPTFDKIGVRVFVDMKNDYSYRVSHNYCSSGGDNPYIAKTHYGFDSEEEALRAASNEIFKFFDPSNEDGAWVINERYNVII